MNSSMSAADRIEAIGFAMAGTMSAMSGADPWTGSPVESECQSDVEGETESDLDEPMMKSSPTFTEGTSPRDPTRAAPPSLSQKPN